MALKWKPHRKEDQMEVAKCGAADCMVRKSFKGLRTGQPGFYFEVELCESGFPSYNGVARSPQEGKTRCERWLDKLARDIQNALARQ